MTVMHFLTRAVTTPLEAAPRPDRPGVRSGHPPAGGAARPGRGPRSVPLGATNTVATRRATARETRPLPYVPGAVTSVAE